MKPMTTVKGHRFEVLLMDGKELLVESWRVYRITISLRYCFEYYDLAKVPSEITFLHTPCLLLSSTFRGTQGYQK